MLLEIKWSYSKEERVEIRKVAAPLSRQSLFRHKQQGGGELAGKNDASLLDKTAHPVRKCSTDRF